MNNLIKIISIISIFLVSIFTLTGCDCEISQNNVTYSKSSDDMTINLEKGYKFVDIKIEIYRRTGRYVIYTLTKKRDILEKPETYNLDLVLSTGYHVSMPKHITVIEN